MDYIQFFSLLAMIAGGCAYLRKEIKNEIDEIRKQGAAQAARTDRLYELYCEAKRDGDQKFYELMKDTDQKFYNLLNKIK